MGVYSIDGTKATRINTMITPVSAATERCNIKNHVRIRQRKLRRRVCRIRQTRRRRIRIQRESAIISYLSARRFPSNSKEALILRLLAQTSIHRVKRLESVLNHRSETSRKQPRKWLLDWKCFCALHVPRPWLLLWLRHYRNR